MGAMPLDHVSYMREHFKDAELATYESFEQELFQRMDEKSMDEEPNRDKKIVKIGAVIAKGDLCKQRSGGR